MIKIFTIVMMCFLISACEKSPQRSPAEIDARAQLYVEERVREVILKDGTRCVTMSDKAITCEWKK